MDIEKVPKSFKNLAICYFFLQNTSQVSDFVWLMNDHNKLGTLLLSFDIVSMSKSLISLLGIVTTLEPFQNTVIKFIFKHKPAKI